MADITLSSGVRSNLLSLQQTASLISTTQNRLATGKKVNSALDNPTNFFTAQKLNSRAGDLSNLLDGISNAIKTIEAADNGIKAITRLVESAQSTAKQALQDKSSATFNVLEGSDQINTSGSSGLTVKEQALNKTLGAAGYGLANGDVFTITTSSGGTSKTFTYNTTNLAAGGSGAGGAHTLADLVSAINASGVASAEVTDAGKLKISSAVNESISIRVENDDANNTAPGAGNVNASSVLNALGFNQAVAGDFTRTNTENAAATDDVTVLTQAAPASPPSTSRAKLKDQFNEILKQINKLADDAGFNGINLLKGSSQQLKVAFNELQGTAKSELTIAGEDLTKTGLLLTDATALDDTEANNKLTELTNALTKLRDAGAKFGSNLSIVQTRQDFTKATINTLKTGADNLVLADTNEEGANLLALQTRQQLSTTALSLAAQADQNVLRLF